MKQDLDTNFEYAYELSEKTFSNDEILQFLLNGNILERQIAALNLKKIDSKEIAIALINNLVGVDGKIREAVAQTLFKNIAMDENAKSFYINDNDSVNSFAHATIDINGNICRYVIDTVNLFQNYTDFCKSYTKFICTFAQEALQELDKFIFRDKKYVINKQLFKLYWCLEALNIFYKYAEEDILTSILIKSSEQNEYTIREKVAQILVKVDNLDDIKQRLKKDENYYVRNILNHKSIC